MNSKPLLTGVLVLGVAVVAGLGIWAATGNNDSVTADNRGQSQSAMTEQPASPQPVAEQKTITELAAGTAPLSTLVTAITAAGLDKTLADTSAKYTVFAPTNDAFAKLPAGTVESLVAPENKQQLTTILTYHVVAAEALSSSLSDGQKIKTVQGNELTVKIQDGKVWIVDAKGGMAQVTTADVKASNGVVHIIDSVLMPL